MEHSSPSLISPYSYQVRFQMCLHTKIQLKCPPREKPFFFIARRGNLIRGELLHTHTFYLDSNTQYIYFSIVNISTKIYSFFMFLIVHNAISGLKKCVGVNVQYVRLNWYCYLQIFKTV